MPARLVPVIDASNCPGIDGAGAFVLGGGGREGGAIGSLSRSFPPSVPGSSRFYRSMGWITAQKQEQFSPWKYDDVINNNMTLMY